MKNRLISGLLCTLLLLGLAAPASAARAQAGLEEAAQVLAALNIMTGDESGNLQLERAVTRAEFVKLTIAASVYADGVGGTASVSPYPDVPKAAWYAPYVQAAKEKELVRGNTKGRFEPERSITLVEGAALALRLLGYQDSDFSGAWGSGQMAMYRALALNENISLSQGDAMTRRDTLWLFYNLLTAKQKTGQVYLTVLGHALTPTGEIDRVAIVNSAMDGPIVAEGSWQAALPFNAGKAKVYRAGAAVTLAAVQTGDLLYWSKPMNSIWAYTGKATGAIGQIAPNSISPGMVTVGGKTYPIETAAAAYALSDLGSFRAGDVVTLLLGRGGGVAAVRAPGEAAGTVYGVVTATGTGTYQDGGGKGYTAGTVTVTATDGGSYTYQWENKDRKLEAGDLVQVSFSSGGADVKRLSKAALTGKVNADGTQIGGYALAADAEILDTYGKTAAGRVYPARLAGVSLKEDMVRYYALNARGEVSRLILSDVTGDIHSYGVLTDVVEQTFDMILMSRYTYDVGGVPGLYTSDRAIWNLEKGPCQIKADGQTVERIYNLSELALAAVSGNKATAGNRDYTIADGAAVYVLLDKTYYLTDLSRVSGGEYILTGWQDKAETDGGLIRVIVAKAR